MTDIAKCAVCGEPMPPGEQMFKFHGYSGPCPKPAQTPSTARGDLKAAATALYMAGRWDCANLSGDEQARMWEALRDALGLSVGTATTAGVHSRHPAAPAGLSEWQRVDSTPRAAEAVTEEWTSELAEVIQTQTGCGDSDAVRAAAASIANINDWLALNPYPRAAVVTEASKAQSAWRRHRLGEIQRIIEAVDDRAMANDDEVPTTMQEMTQAEMSRIYDLSRGVNCGELEALTPPFAKGE